MIDFPDNEQKLKQRISRYKSSLNKEKREHGFISDGGGKRYLLFCLYFLLGDLKKSGEYFEWYETEFSDDTGEPIQFLCWALTLFHMGKKEQAKLKLAELMLSNLYMIPILVGRNIDKYDMWHSSNYEDIDYIEYLLSQIRETIQNSDRDWMAELYDSFEFRRIRRRYIEIYHDLQHEKEVENRKKLLAEAYCLLDMLQ